MHTLVIAASTVAVLGVSTSARANEFADALVGLSIPVGNSNWTNLVNPSPKLALRGGVLSGDLGGMLAIDWTPETLDNPSFQGVDTSSSSSLQRVRAIASVMVRHRIAPRITLTGRGGAGIDIAHATLDGRGAAGFPFHTADTDVGYAFEFGAGVWFDVRSIQVGFELAVPIGHHHDRQAQPFGELPFQYTDVDLDLLVGIRF